MAGPGLASPSVSISEAQAYVRIDTGEEEALVAGLIRTASAICEAFLNQIVVAREFREEIHAGCAWARLAASPVAGIGSVEAVAADGSATLLGSTEYAVDIDSSGDGWVRLTGAPRRVRVSGTAGLAPTHNEVPEPIRQGVLRLVAHLFNARDGVAGDPPAAVTALWRPYRRMRLA